MAETTSPGAARPAEAPQVGMSLALQGMRRKQTSLWGDAWRRLRRNKMAVAGMVVVTLLCLVALFSPVLAREELGYQNYDALYHPPEFNLRDPTYIWGADQLGRSVLYRVIHGARVSVLVGLVAQLIVLAIGLPVGAIAGYFGGAVDDLVMRGTDVLMAIPGIGLALVVLAATGPSLLGVVLAIAIGGVPGDIRLARSQTLYERGLDYVAAARAIGSSSGRLMYRHILPNIGSVLIVRGTTSLGAAILVESGLSFLGLGVPPPTPTWGAMISEGRQFIFTAAHVGLIPGLVIMVTVLAFNVTGDGLRDVLDPRSSVRTRS